MSGKAYYDEKHSCWYIPVAEPPLLEANLALEPCRLELRNGVLRIALLDEQPKPIGYRVTMSNGAHLSFAPDAVEAIYGEKS